MAKTYFEVLQWASSFLEQQGVEAASILYVFLTRKGWSKTDWLLNMRDAISPSDQQQVEQDVACLATHYPPQYLVGAVEFYGQPFTVTEATLIPRPETEELVDLCLNENQDGTELRVVDVGTGTGAIAISLQLARPQWRITAIDLSSEALAVAQKNAKTLQAPIELVHGDLLQPLLANNTKVDIIVSNPPYISAAEWTLMDESVRTFEPKTALFAEEEGLALYRKLAEQAPQVLTANGKLYLEIGFQQGPAVQALFMTAFPQKRVRILTDLSGLPRMIAVTG